jgi:MinD-like ATPase involved in chromosome partitioning or flagellar assembly
VQLELSHCAQPGDREGAALHIRFSDRALKGVTVTILCEPDQEVADVLTTFISGDVRTVASLPVAALALDADPRRTLVVVGAGLELDQALQFATQLRLAKLAAAVILLRESPDADLLAQAAEAGVFEVVPAGDGAALSAACERFRSEVAAVVPLSTPEPDETPGRVITVFSAKGGCGKTTLATNLAVVLSASGEDRVCLVDLDLDFGDVAISLRLTPSRTLLDAAELQKAAHAAADPIPLHGLTTPFAPGLDCVLAPAEPGDGDRIPAGLVASLLADLRTHYDYVVVDTPSHFSEHVLAALDATDHYLLVTTPELPSLKNLRLTLDMFDLLGYARDKRLIVFNRSDDQTGLTAADIESTVKSLIAAHVPSSRDVPVSINKGVPLAQSNPKHPVSVALRNFVNVAVRQETTHAEGRRRGRRDAVRKR